MLKHPTQKIKLIGEEAKQIHILITHPNKSDTNNESIWE